MPIPVADALVLGDAGLRLCGRLLYLQGATDRRYHAG